MSDEFLEFHFPCKECLVRAVCEEKPEINDTDKKRLIERDRTHCLTLPYVSDEKHYHRMIIECWANLGWRVFNSVSNVENPVGVSDPMKVPIRFVFWLRDIANIMQYIVNSTSWETGKLEDFDKDEINRKVKMLKL